MLYISCCSLLTGFIPVPFCLSYFELELNYFVHEKKERINLIVDKRRFSFCCFTCFWKCPVELAGSLRIQSYRIGGMMECIAYNILLFIFEYVCVYVYTHCRARIMYQINQTMYLNHFLSRITSSIVTPRLYTVLSGH